MSENTYPLYPYTDIGEVTMLQMSQKGIILDDYIKTLRPDEVEVADIFARDIHDRDVPLADTVVIIPVAAAQESARVGHAISEYARQRTNKPFTLVLGLNIDGEHFSADDKSVRATRSAITRATAAHPNLDVRTTFLEYPEPTIGCIRRDLWNGVLFAKNLESKFSSTTEIIAVNHDIDVVKIPQLYLHAIQKRMAHPMRAIAPAYAQTKHAFDPKHPLLSKAVFWNDFINSQTQSGYEAGAIIPMTHYALQTGFDATRKTHEVGSITGPAGTLVKTGHLETSPRRFIDRLRLNGFGGIWTTESFGSHDTCRDTNQMEKKPDLTDFELFTLIDQNALGEINNMVTKVCFNSLNLALYDLDIDLVEMNIKREISRVQNIAERALGLVMPDMADARDYIDESMHDLLIATTVEQIASHGPGFRAMLVGR